MRRLKSMLDFSSQFDEYGRMIQNGRKLSYTEIFGEEIQNDEGFIFYYFIIFFNFYFRNVQSDSSI